MSKVGTLFDRPLAHTNDPQTSFDAGQKMVDLGKLNRQEQAVYEAILKRAYLLGSIGPDFTPKEIAAWVEGDYNKNYYIAQRRLSGLRAKGKIERTGEKRDGCCVWRLSERK